MQCIICMEAKKEFVVFPCSHMLYCEKCIKHVMEKKQCFFCGTAANHHCRIYY